MTTPCCSCSAPPTAVGSGDGLAAAAAHFARMIPNCLAYAQEAKAQGRPIVGILCEFTPRELLLAAGAVPVCLCGGTQATIPAAESLLPANLCPLIKSTFGYHLLGSNPLLELADLVVAETTCDGKKKMYELMGQSRPMYVLELPQKAADGDALAHWRRELDKLRAMLEARFGVAITADRLRQAIELMNAERGLRRALAELLRRDPPPISGRQLLQFKSSIAGIPADLAQYQAALNALTTSPSTACAAAPAATGGPPAVRVLLTGVPVVHGAERIVDLIESRGGAVVCMENCTGLKPIVEDVDPTAADPMDALAEKYFHLPCSVMTANDRRMDLLRRLAADYRPECVVELIWQACLTYDVESARVRRLVEDELRLPYLRIETDYSPSDSERIGVRVEALFETVEATRANRRGCPAGEGTCR